ncbi:MAG: hypothetical protein WDZ77_02125 [Candidatus Pacearchaeota archaeon]
MAKRKVGKVASRKTSKKPVSRSTQNKMNRVFKYFAIFLGLFLISTGLYQVTGNEFLADVFSMTAVITGFIVLALIIAYLVFWFAKVFKKK